MSLLAMERSMLRVPAAAAAAAAASRSLAVWAALEEREPVWQCTAAETPQPSTTGASPAPPMRHADWTQVCVWEGESERE